MPQPTFKEASDLLCLSIRELAELLDVSEPSVKQARLDPGSAGYRTPPPGWEAVLAEVAAARGEELRELAERLRG